MTTKKRGRGRPKKTEKPAEKSLPSKYLEKRHEQYFDIKTGEVTTVDNSNLARALEAHNPIREEVKTVMEADFSIRIDNETHDRGVRFIKKDDHGLAEIILAKHYLEDFEFSQFINGIIIRAARMKADKLTLDLELIRG